MKSIITTLALVAITWFGLDLVELILGRAFAMVISIIIVTVCCIILGHRITR